MTIAVKLHTGIVAFHPISLKQDLNFAVVTIARMYLMTACQRSSQIDPCVTNQIVAYTIVSYQQLGLPILTINENQKRWSPVSRCFRLFKYRGSIREGLLYNVVRPVYKRTAKYFGLISMRLTMVLTVLQRFPELFTITSWRTA